MPRALPEYDALEIRLTPGRGDSYNVEIAAASGARGHGSFAAPAELDLGRFRLTVDPRNRRVRGGSRYLEAARQFGEGLFDALVGTPSVREVYTAAWRDATVARRGLRVTLSLRAVPELAGIPWEFLYDRPRFLANHVNSPVVRFVDLEDPPSPLRVEAPLRILGMVSRPKDDALATLDAEQEQAALAQQLDPLISGGSVTLRWLAQATLPELQQEVDHGEDFHVFHYIGHGEYDEDTGESSLILEHSDRRARRVSGQQLGELLCDRGSLRLAVLNACETAQTAAHDPLAGIATSLMEYDVPAVVAMQFAITDESALIFADEFYRALASGYAVDAAVTQARRALAAHSDVEWGTPVLFMRVADGRLFDLESTALPQTPVTLVQPGGESETAASAVREQTRMESVEQQADAGLASNAPPETSASSSRAPSSTATGENDRELTRVSHDGRVRGVAFSPDGSRIVTASSDDTARVWDIASGREVARVNHTDEVIDVAFSPDGTRISTASSDRTARMWDIAGGRELARIEDQSRFGAAFSPDATRVATANWYTARVCDFASGRELARVKQGFPAAVTRVAFGPDGRWIATCSSLDESARVWDVASGRELVRVSHSGWRQLTNVAFSPDGTRIATASFDKSARVWEVTSGRELARVKHGGRVNGVAFSPDGTRIATASDDKTARVWDIASGRELARVKHGDGVNGVAFSPDGTRIATASDDKTARVWSVA